MFMPQLSLPTNSMSTRGLTRLVHRPTVHSLTRPLTPAFASDRINYIVQKRQPACLWKIRHVLNSRNSSYCCSSSFSYPWIIIIIFICSMLSMLSNNCKCHMFYKMNAQSASLSQFFVCFVQRFENVNCRLEHFVRVLKEYVNCRLE